MNVIVKSILLSALGVCCLTLGSGAQQPPPPVPPTPAIATTVAQTPGFPAPVAVPAQNAFGGGTFLRGYGFGDPSDSQAVQLAKQIIEAKDDDKDKLKDKLKTLLTKQFDDRQKRHEQEIEALEKQIKKLKDLVAKRADSKKEIIDDRTKQLERDAKGLGW